MVLVRQGNPFETCSFAALHHHPVVVVAACQDRWCVSIDVDCFLNFHRMLYDHLKNPIVDVSFPSLLLTAQELMLL
jgi:hypothetical protein